MSQTWKGVSGRERTQKKKGKKNSGAFADLSVFTFQETDYIMSYFDNGEDFGVDSDDNMDEAIY